MSEPVPFPAPFPALHVAEPPATYLQQAPVVVDCSAMAALVFMEPWQEQALQQMRGRSLHAPFLLQNEIASVALKKARAGLPDLARDGLAQFDALDLELHPIGATGAYELAQRYGLTAYDAAYLWLADALRAPLATFDERLGQAARQHFAARG